MDFQNARTQRIFGMLILILVIVLGLAYILLKPKKVKIDSNEAIPQEVVVKETEDGSLKLVQEDSGEKIVESKDYQITKEEAKDKLQIEDGEEFKYVIPGAASPRFYEEMNESENPDFDLEEWQLNALFQEE